MGCLSFTQTGTSSGRGEVDDLMNQVMEEVELDNITTERFDEVEQRLARLKGQDMGKKWQWVGGNRGVIFLIQGLILD